MSGDEKRPALRVVRGEPTAEELAVITALVTAAASSSGPSDEPQRPTRGHWTDPRLQTRRQLYPGPGAWRAATWG